MSNLRIALQAIAAVTTNDTTDHKALCALMVAVARIALDTDKEV